MHVSDIMSAPVYTIEANETAAAAWETMFFCRTRHLVVTDAEGRVVGVVQEVVGDEVRATDRDHVATALVARRDEREVAAPEARRVARARRIDEPPST